MTAVLIDRMVNELTGQCEAPNFDRRIAMAMDNFDREFQSISHLSQRELLVRLGASLVSTNDSLPSLSHQARRSVLPRQGSFCRTTSIKFALHWCAPTRRQSRSSSLSNMYAARCLYDC